MVSTFKLLKLVKSLLDGLQLNMQLFPPNTLFRSQKNRIYFVDSLHNKIVGQYLQKALHLICFCILFSLLDTRNYRCYRNETSAIFSRMFVTLKSIEWLTFTQNEIAASVRCVSSTLVVLNAKLFVGCGARKQRVTVRSE